MLLTRSRLQRWLEGKEEPEALTAADELGEGLGCLGRGRHQNQVWVGRLGVVALVNTVEDVLVRRLDLPSEAMPRAIAEEPDGRLWVATAEPALLMTLAPRKQAWSHARTRAEGVVKFTSEGEVVVPEGRQVSLIQPNGNIEHSLPSEEPQAGAFGAPVPLPFAEVAEAEMRLTVDKGGLWLATRSNGLWRHTFAAGDSEEPPLRGLGSSSLRAVRLVLFALALLALAAVLAWHVRRRVNRARRLRAREVPYIIDQAARANTKDHAGRLPRLAETQGDVAVMMNFMVGPAAQGDGFYGRGREVESLLSHPWAWVCGQRRIGKTSLMLRLCEAARGRDWLPLYYDISKIRKEDATGEEFFNRFFRAHHRKILKGLGFERHQFDGLRPEAAFGELAEQLVEKGRTVLFLWDEAERLIDIHRRDPGFLNALAAHLRTLGAFRLVIAGTQTLAELFPREARVSSFISSFKWMPLPGLAEADARRLLGCEQTGGWPSPLPGELVEEAVDWCGGHPLVLQEIGSNLFLETDGRGKAVTSAKVKKCRKTLFGNQSLCRIFLDDQRRLTPPQQAVLRTVCEHREGLTLDDVCQTVGFHRPQVEAATGFLENFGYLNWNRRIGLQFRFYPGFLSANQGDSVTTSEKVERLKPTLFVSYCHKDAALFERLMTFLRPLLQSSESLCVWSDQEISAGKRWDDEIRQGLERAHVGLLLITQDFLDSEYIRDVEVPALVGKTQEKQTQEKRLRLLGLHAGASNVEGVRYKVGTQKVRLTDYQGLNNPAEPPNSLTEPEKERRFAEISKAVVACLEEVRTGGSR